MQRARFHVVLSAETYERVAQIARQRSLDEKVRVTMGQVIGRALAASEVRGGFTVREGDQEP